MAWDLKTKGKTQTEIAQILGKSQSAVSRWLTKLQSTQVVAQLRVRNRALEVAEATIDGVVRAAKKGAPEAGLELLDRVEVIARRQSAGGGITILIGMPGLPAGPAPFASGLPAPTSAPGLPAERNLAGDFRPTLELSPADFRHESPQEESAK